MKRIIPCLDVDAGRVVKGVKFVDIRDAGDPVAVARRYNEEGADEITFLDITASSDDRETIVHVVEHVAEEVFIPLTVGGGIRKVEDVRRMLMAGADKVAINTAAVFNPEFVKEAADRFGSQCIVVAIDAVIDRGYIDEDNLMVTGESGAGLVKATCTAKGELKSLDIDPSIFNWDDKEVVEDLILAAIKDAQVRAQEKSKEELGKLTEEMGLPPGMNLPF